MARAAIERGYEYLAICDHTVAVSVVPGLDADAVRRQGEEIAAANERLAPFRVLRGIECDIRADATLDLPDDVLAELDWVMASVHAGQRGSRDELTKRTVEAMYHPSVSAISHPTGRLIDRRPPNALDLDTAFQVALETGTALETNGLPDRLDLKDDHVRQAVEAGIPIVVSTDAHSTRGLGNIVLALGTARRGWATAADVVNTRPLEEILASRKPGLQTAEPGPVAVHSRRSYQWLSRSASATFSSVCSSLKTCLSRSQQISIESSETSARLESTSPGSCASATV